MAVINHIIKNDLTDKDYIDKYTDGFDELKSHVTDKTPEWAAKITGVNKEDIEKLALELASNQPAAIRIGVALERHHGGGQTIRAVTCIPALTGAWKHVGGGITQFPYGNILISLMLFVDQILSLRYACSQCITAR